MDACSRLNTWCQINSLTTETTYESVARCGGDARNQQEWRATVSVFATHTISIENETITTRTLLLAKSSVGDTKKEAKKRASASALAELIAKDSKSLFSTLVPALEKIVSKRRLASEPETIWEHVSPSQTTREVPAFTARVVLDSNFASLLVDDEVLVRVSLQAKTKTHDEARVVAAQRILKELS